MPTEKPAVMAYLNPGIYAQLLEFKTKNRMRSLSHAVEEILQEYFDKIPVAKREHFGLTQQLDRLLQEQQNLRAEFANLEKSARSPAKSSVVEEISTIIKQPASSSQSGQEHKDFSPLEGDFAEIKAEVINQEIGLTAEVTKKGLTGVQLAERLQTNCSMISRRRSKADFSEWSRFNDPDSLAWTYVPFTRRFYPLP